MSSLSHHGIKGQKWGVRRFQNKDGTLTAAGRKRQQYLIEVGSGKRKRLVEAAKSIGTSGDYSRDVTGLNKRGIRGRVINEDDNTHIIKKGTSIYRTANNSELNDDGTYGSLTKNDVDRYIDYGRSGELPGADKSNLDSMKIFEFSANRDLKIANGKYITEIITDDVKRRVKNGDADQVKLGKEILESFKRYEEDLNLSFSTSEMWRSKEAASRTEKEKEFDRDLVGKASDRLALYDKTILDYSSGKDYRVIRDRLKREGYDGFIDVEDVTTIENLVRGGANTEYPVVILNANDVLTLKRSIKESETQRRLKRGTKFNSSRGELDNVVQHTSIGGTMYIEGNALILGDSSYLEHHGIKGQRWGIRRFQNEDGSLTPLGEKRIKKLKKIGDKRNKQQASLYGQSNLYSAKSIQPIFGKFKNLDSETEVLKAGAKINRIATENEPLDDKRKYVSFTSGDNAKYKFFAEVKELGLPKDAEPYAYQFRAIKDIRIANGKAIESFIVNDIKATSTSKKQKEEAKKIIEAFDKHLDNEAIIQGASKVLEKAMSVKEGSDNHFYKEAGIKANDQIDLYRNTIKTYLEGDPKKVKKLADHLRSRGYDAYLDMVDARSSVRWKYGTDYPLIMMSPKDNMELVKSEKLKHTSIGGPICIQDNILIVNSSYLEHHGIRGQRWGVRRFQNRDGSLTNAGRKRLGYATKGAAQAVKKAFNAGVKTGAKAVKAAKAHHEKAEAKKIEKKKEKASKTRAGVYANKDLFTAKELKELNSKFEEQDKLTMARLKKGVEIAKAVGQYAQTAKQIGDAYQSITGKNILSHITEIKSANEAKAKEEKEAADKAKAEAEAAAKKAKSKAMAKEALQKNIDAFKADQESDARVKDLEKQGNKTAAKTKLAEYVDRYNQDKAAQEQTKQMMKNQKLQEYIDRANKAQREKDAATLKETTDRGKQVIDVLKKHTTDANLLVEDYQNRIANTGNSKKPSSTPDSGNLMNLVRKAKASGETQEAANRAAKALNLLGEKGGGFNTETPKSTPAPAPKPVPSSNNLMAQIRAAQTKLEKPNKNETPAEHKEAQKKLNALEKVANEYKAAANKPGTDSAEVAEKLLKKNKDILDSIKHMDFGDDVYLEHHGVRGMKWGKHLMAGKGGGIYDGTALGGGGGGGPMTEEERKKAEELRKKKLEEAKKKAEEAAKEKEIEEKAKEIGISVSAYKRYSIENNHLPGKHHYNKSLKLHGEASSSLAETQAAERQAHMNRAKAASLMRKVNSSHMFDADGYHISQQRGDDRKEAKQLKKEAKQLDKKSKKALKKFYKKRYKSDREWQKWQNSTSGKYHHMMRHYEIQNGVLFVDSSYGLAHHGVKGQRWGVRRFQNPDGSLTDNGRKYYEKALAKEKLKQSDMEEGMYHVENGTLFINAGEPYLEHHGVKGMKWGKHLMAGKGVDAEGGGGGGFAEDDEKLKEMAKKAGMTVAEYRTKMAGKLSGAASKVGSAVYDAAGGSHKKSAEEYQKLSRDAYNEARKYEASGNADLAKAASARRKGNTPAHSSYKTTGDNAKDEARKARERASALSEGARQEQARYEKSLAGKYDKMKADRARKKSIKQRQDKAFSGTSPKAKKKVRIESASAMGFSTNNPYSIPVDARRWGYNATNKSRVSVGKRGDNMPKTVLNPKHTDTSHRKKSVGEVMNNAKNPTPGNTPIQSPTQYARANRPRGREKYYKLGQESKGVKKRSRRVKHFDGSDELYTEGTRLVINSKWG